MRRPADGSARGSVGGGLPEPIRIGIIVGMRTFGGSFVCAHTIQYTQYILSTLHVLEACVGTYKYTESYLSTLGLCIVGHIYIYFPVVFSTARK